MKAVPFFKNDFYTCTEPTIFCKIKTVKCTVWELNTFALQPITIHLVFHIKIKLYICLHCKSKGVWNAILHTYLCRKYNECNLWMYSVRVLCVTYSEFSTSVEDRVEFVTTGNVVCACTTILLTIVLGSLVWKEIYKN